MNKIEWQKKQRLDRQIQGLCTQCGKPSDNYKCCLECRNKQKQYIDKCKKEGFCCSCGNLAAESFKWCETCLAKRKMQSRNRRKINREEGLCSYCSNLAEYGKCLCIKCNNRIKERYAKNKKLVFDFYGRKCTCCGIDSDNFLQIDHIESGGGQHKNSIGINFYRWLVKNNFPDGFQTLCANCNYAKWLCGGCPHKYVNFIDESRLGKSKMLHLKDRSACFGVYGNFCACCGEAQKVFLQVDHINNDGHLQRKNDLKQKKIYRWLRRNKYPEGFQILCANCNWAKRYGICPHKILKSG